jgi:replication factor C large subunit
MFLLVFLEFLCQKPFNIKHSQTNMSLFTIKYAPKNQKQIFGQQAAVLELLNFIQNYKTQKHKTALIHGPIGVGKTSSVYALAKELGYDILEINSSDLRNEVKITSFLSAALGQQSLFFTPKLILIDEVDMISGVKDRGCVKAVLKAVEKSTFPVILTANDITDKKLKPLKKISTLIDFHALEYRSIAHGLAWVCEQEGISFEEKALNSLARQADGDMRAALLDLHICAAQGKIDFADVTKLSARKRTQFIINALHVIFKSSTANNALRALDDVDVDFDQIFFWLEANLPREYKSASSLAKAYECLSRADVFRGRIRKRQHWRFLVYMSNLLSAGVSAAKDGKNPEFVTYKPTMRMLRMWQAKMKFAKKKEIALKLAAKTHTSKKVALAQVPYFQSMFRSGGCEDIAADLDLSEEEVEWLRK